MDNRDRLDRLAEDFRHRMLDKAYQSSYREVTLAGVIVIMCLYFIFK